MKLIVTFLLFIASTLAACNNGVAGTCQDYRYNQCQGFLIARFSANFFSASERRATLGAIRSDGGAPYYLTGYCPGDKYNKCCKASSSSPGGNQPDPNPVLPSQPVGSGGGVFPVTSGSLGSISVNWGGSRSGGSRCHAGIDLYTTGAARIQAIAAGTVVSIMRGWYVPTIVGKKLQQIQKKKKQKQKQKTTKTMLQGTLARAVRSTPSWSITLPARSPARRSTTAR
jgi:hypothetical protein